MKRYRRGRYKKHIRLRYNTKAILIGFFVLVFILSFFSHLERRKSSEKAEEARSRSHLIETGYDRDRQSMAQSDKADMLSKLLAKELGKPYIYGAEGPDSFDCSGLMKFVFSKMDIYLPRMSWEQANFGVPVEKDSLLFGDMVFFAMDSPEINHVGVYIGNGYFEHAPKSGDVVKISSLDSEYYSRAFKKAVRLLS